MNCVVCQASTDSFACTRCLSRCERNIGDFPALLAELDVTISRQSRTYRAGSGQRQREDATVAGSEARHERHERATDGTLDPYLRSKHGKIALRAFAAPVDFDAAEVRWEAWNTLTTWARHLAESRGAEPPSDDRLIGWLLFNADAIRHDEAAAEIIDEIGYAHDQIERAIDRSPERVFAGPCRVEHEDRSCVRDLYLRPDGRLVCDGWRGDREGCGAEHSVAERQDWLRDSIDDALVSIEEVVGVLPTLLPHYPQVKKETMLAWVRAGRLLPHGTNRVGEPTFVGAEILGMIRNHQTRRYAPRPNRAKARISA